MGNSENKSDDAFKMNICIIGNQLDTFYKTISNKNSIKNCWTFEKGIGNENSSRISNYFQKLEEMKKGSEKDNIRECLLVRIGNITDPEVNLIIEKMNKLSQVQYMPLVLLLLDNFTAEKIPIDKKYKNIDSRLIFRSKFYEDEENIKKEIDPILLRFCSIHNELGDRFTYKKGDNLEDFDLIETYYPFNINIACVGRFGQGKSAGVNAILQEYKAKESSKGCSQTKELTFYQVTNQPVKLLDIPGFESVETVKSAVEKFQECGKEINKIKDNLHIVLYFLNYCEERTFMDLEVPIIEEIGNYKGCKVIYVITHSDPNMDDEEKENKIQNINEGLQGILKKNNSDMIKETNPGGILEASNETVVFVNFYDDKKTKFKKFGLFNLFQTIYKFFIQTDDYKNFINNDNLNDEELNKRIELLKLRAKDIIFKNKI